MAEFSGVPFRVELLMSLVAFPEFANSFKLFHHMLLCEHVQGISRDSIIMIREYNQCRSFKISHHLIQFDENYLKVKGEYDAKKPVKYAS